MAYRDKRVKRGLPIKTHENYDIQVNEKGLVTVSNSYSKQSRK